MSWRSLRPSRFNPLGDLEMLQSEQVLDEQKILNQDDNWIVRETTFNPTQQHHAETIFTIGNGYLSTRGAFEEGYPGDRRATFIHGVFDAAPILFTELANAPDWLPLTIYLNGERFALDRGTVESFSRALDLRNAVLTRTVRWRSPKGDVATITFERFASLADEHALYQRARIIPEFAGTLEIRGALNANTFNEGTQQELLMHWQWVSQGVRGDVVYLHERTLKSKIDVAYAMQLKTTAGHETAREFWDVENVPTLIVRFDGQPGQEVVVEKKVGVFTSRDVPGAEVVEQTLNHIARAADWEDALEANARAWQQEWERTAIVIEGDDEAQLAIRFNLYQMLIAAPRHDDRVNIGAKTLSGFGYRGHSFWDTEIFMLPLFTYTAPHIAKNLLNYRYLHLDGAHRKARANGYEGAQFPWESADRGDEVTPKWVPHFSDPTRLVRIWPGDIELHISADIAYAAYQYHRVTQDDEWFIEKGAELILDTAKFWASRAEWNADKSRYEINDVIGPDENHDHINNNFYTNRMAQWNIQTGLEVLDWLKTNAALRGKELVAKLDLSESRRAHWHEVIEKLYLPVTPSGVIEQFEGYFQLKDIDLKSLEPRTISVQQLFGIEGAQQVQLIKQPDVLMLLYLLRDHYSDDIVRVNYDYYTPRTDLTFGSSLGPSIQAIMACEVGEVDDAYIEFMRAARADLYDVRGNANDGIHAASAAGTWQTVVFGFGGLKIAREGWTTQARLPKHWKRLAFRFFYRGKLEQVDLKGASDD
jgi:kojibiose phosphorylase